MDKKLIETLRAAGNEAARRHLESGKRWEADLIESLDPYYFDDREPQRVPDWKKALAVEWLLDCIEASSGPEVAADIRAKLDFRYDKYPEGDVYIQGLNEDRWLNYAHAVGIAALEYLHSNPATVEIETLSVAETASLKDASEMTIRRILNDPERKAATFPGAQFVGSNERRGDWRIPVVEVERWNPRGVGRSAGGHARG